MAFLSRSFSDKMSIGCKLKHDPRPFAQALELLQAIHDTACPEIPCRLFLLLQKKRQHAIVSGLWRRRKPAAASP